MQSVFRVGLVAAIALVFLLVPRVASAHAVVVQSSPAVNETVQGPDVDGHVEIQLAGRWKAIDAAA